jgi:hypothetical protein
VKSSPSPDVLSRRKTAAEARVSEALEQVEEAQMLLGRACASLSSVVGMVSEWRKLSARYDQVHAAWYAVERKAAALRARGRLLLDRVPPAEEAQESLS